MLCYVLSDALILFLFAKFRFQVRVFTVKKRIDNRLRITIGTDEEIDALISALKEYIK